MSSSFVMTGNFGRDRPIDVNCWRRIGRGKSVEVDLSANDLVSILSTEAERHNADWRLIVCQKILRDSCYQQVTEVLPIDELTTYVAQGFWQYFLWSPKISPAIGDLLRERVSESTLSILGLINIQCGRQGRAGVAKTAIGLVDKVRHIVSNNQVEHKEYLYIFQTLRRSMLKARKSE